MKKDLQALYPEAWKEISDAIDRLVGKHACPKKAAPLSEEDAILVTYGDTIRSPREFPLATLARFLEEHGGSFSTVHLLPIHPYTSDDGFAVVDFTAVNPKLGGWDDIARLAASHDLMLDAVINHVSEASRWFRGFLRGEEAFSDFFIEEEEGTDYSRIVRPRATPLFHEYATPSGKKRLWTTFSADQPDLNYQNPRVLLRILDILISFAKRGARFLRLDAVGFLWKAPPHPSIHHENTHRLIRIMRRVLERTVPGTFLVAETNVPHKENITYFGKNADEAHLVYQFALPPLILHAYHARCADTLHEWSVSLTKDPPGGNAAFLNFLASHDGIGLRPVEGLLPAKDIEALVTMTREKGGLISYRSTPGGGRAPYELNIDFFDALREEKEDPSRAVEKFLGAHAILLGMRGVPAIYIHSFLASGGDADSARRTGIPRRINRQTLAWEGLERDLADPASRRRLVSDALKKLLDIRSRTDAFHPSALQTGKHYDSRVFSFVREGESTRLLVLVNVSNETVRLETDFSGIDLLSGASCGKSMHLPPYGSMWVQAGGD